MGLTLLCSGKRLEEVAPLVMTVRWVRTRHGSGWALAAIGDDGMYQSLVPDFDDDEVCMRPTAYAARIMVLDYAVRWMEQGLRVEYRSDLELGPEALAA